MNKVVALRNQIAECMEAGDTLEQMETEINSSGLSEEERSALWLFPWSYLPGAAQRNKAIAASQMLAETYDGPGAVEEEAPSSGEKLADIMEAVREHEDRTRSRAGSRRPADDWLYKRVRAALSDR
jgi:IS5 family transposase